MIRKRQSENRPRAVKPSKRWNTKNEILLNAVTRGQFTTVKRLIERSFTDIDSRNTHGMNCLQLAIIHGHYKLAEYLIHRGIDVQSTDQEGWTALHDAALRNTKSLSRKLISKGASVTHTTNMGELPIDVAGSVEIERFLCEQMVVKGEADLARQYYVYLGLGHLEGARNCLLEDSQSLQAHTTRNGPGTPKEPSFSNSNVGQKESASGKERGLSSVGQDALAWLRNHRNDSIDAEVKSCLAGSSREVIIDRAHPESVPAASSINALRSSFSPQLVHRDFSYSASLCISRDDLVKKATAREDQFARPHERPVRKVSFATNVEQLHEPMARTKSLHSANWPVAVEKAILESPLSSRRPVSVSASSSLLSMEELTRLAHLYEERCDGGKPISSSDSEGSTFDPGEAISKLKMRPRKSSIATPDRRRHSEPGKRRSVSFQPEVLLQDIVTVGDVKEVRQVLQSGIIPDVNKMSPAGLTALHQSAIDGNMECAETLVRNGANVNSTDCEQWTPLHAAAMSGHASLVQFLLSSGADASLKNEEGETAYDVAKTGQIRKLLLCAMNGKNPDGDDFSDGEFSGEEEDEYSHAESESDSDESESAGSPLFGSSKPTLKERLGFNSSTKTNRDTSISPSPDLEQLDNVFSSSSDTLIPPPPTRREREMSDSTSSYGSLLDHESDTVSELDDHRSTRGHTRPTEVDPGKVSEDQGISTMEGSSDCSHRSRTLSDDEGTSRDVLDSDLVPGSLDYRFQQAVMHSDVDCVLKLVKHRQEIDVNRVNKNSGITALHHAVLEENFALVQHLVKDLGAALNIKDVDGWTPLHAASAVGNICTAQYLLDSGAKPSILNNQCEFPVDVAEDEAMEKLLKNAMLGPSMGKMFTGIFT